jgi:putative iron-dependent peroxidase
MLENMFIGRPPGNYDRNLDFSQALTGSLFFLPTATFLDAVGEDAPPAADATDPEPPQSNDSRNDGSLSIGSLKGDLSRE